MASEKADETIEAAKKTAGKAQDKVEEGAEQVKEKAESAQQPDYDDHSEEASLPQTPLGGTDPTADGTPSFAEMAAGPPHEVERKGGKQGDDEASAAPQDEQTDDNNKADDYDSSQMPHTPLGGTDPLANNAPSFAQAVAHHAEVDSQENVDNQNQNDGQSQNDSQKHDENDESADELPHTPFGGTDPLASGAPSYAQASHE